MSRNGFVNAYHAHVPALHEDSFVLFCECLVVCTHRMNQHFHQRNGGNMPCQWVIVNTPHNRTHYLF
jgi:hypothetical protein